MTRDTPFVADGHVHRCVGVAVSGESQALTEWVIFCYRDVNVMIMQKIQSHD